MQNFRTIGVNVKKEMLLQVTNFVQRYKIMTSKYDKMHMLKTWRKQKCDDTVQTKYTSYHEYNTTTAIKFQTVQTVQ